MNNSSAIHPLAQKTLLNKGVTVKGNDAPADSAIGIRKEPDQPRDGDDGCR